MCTTSRPAELVVHDDKSHLHHDPALSPCHSPNMHVPVLTLPGQRHILVGSPLPQLCPCLATWNAPSKGQGSRDLWLVITSLSPHDPMHKRGTHYSLISAPATVSHTCILQC